jgi:Ser/Thr protein kinase RdoA (MazF antagonist)
MNDIAIVTTASDKVVLRGHRCRERWRVELEHRVMAFARDRGIPVPDLIATPTGEHIIEREGRFYSLSRYAIGQQPHRDTIDTAHAEAMGRALASLHVALEPFPTDNAPRARRAQSYEPTLRRIDELLACVAAVEQPSQQDAWALERLRTRAEWLHEHAETQHPTVEGEQMVHGDYQDTNLFFNDGRVSAIIDWDKAEVRAPGEEVVRAMHLSLGLDPSRSNAFLAGYRSGATLSDHHLRTGAIAYGQQRICDLWLYETIYLHRDDRARRFLTPGPFIPFTDQWEPLQTALA